MKITKIYHPEEHRRAKQNVLRVAAYCRVSTKFEEQEESFETQQAVYTDKINNQEGWEMAGIYADLGISGTMARKRPEFLRMIGDCEKGLIDCIICKSISRFARSSQDAVFYIRLLRDLGVRLIFEKEDVDTDCTYSEFLLTILAAFAEEESRSISENEKWGKRKRAQAGETPMVKVYGYDNSGDNYEIIPEEAETVRLIFDLYEHGSDSIEIARALSEKGIRSAKGKVKWTDGVIRKMINNEKLAGDYLTQKGFTDDFITKRRRLNKGILPSVYIRDHHPAIVSRDQFERCNLILKLRRNDSPLKYPFADFLRCPHCGHFLVFRNKGVGPVFCCEGEGACRKFVIKATPVKTAVLEAYNALDIREVQKIAESGDPEMAAEARKLLETKDKYPAFETVHYWWLDDLVERITFGRHSHTASELRQMGVAASAAADDRTVSIHWRCGLTTVQPSGVVRDDQDPGKKAETWDAFVLKHPDRYPQLAEEIKRIREGEAGVGEGGLNGGYREDESAD